MIGDEDAPEAEVTAELAKPEDASAYIEQRREDEEAESPPADEGDKLIRDLREKHGLDDTTKKASRYERLKRARDSYKAEAEELRQKYESRPSEADTHPMPGDRPEQSFDSTKLDAGAIENSLKFAGDKHGIEKFHAAYHAFTNHVTSTGDKATYNKVMSSTDVGEALVEWYEQGGSQAPQQPQDPYQAALEQGRQDTNYQAAIAERESQIRVETAAAFRANEFAKTVPDFAEQMEFLRTIETVPGVMADLIQRSEVGPQIAYALAQDAIEGEGLIWNLPDLAGDALAQARLVGVLEQQVRNYMNRSHSPQRATRAPRPIEPIKGGSGGPKDLHSLAQSEDAEAYIRARRS